MESDVEVCGDALGNGEGCDVAVCKLLLGHDGMHLDDDVSPDDHNVYKLYRVMWEAV